jgi:hypothetical protein
MTRCPYCNKTISVTLRKVADKGTKVFAAKGAKWTGESAAVLQAVEQPPSAMPRRCETPVRAPTVESDVLVPVLHAVIPSIPITILTGLGWLRAGWPCPGYAVVVSFFAVSLGFWTLNKRDFTALLWRFEEWAGVDVTGDDEIGEPKSDRPVVVQVWDRQGGYKKRPSGLTRSEMDKVAEVIASGKSFSRGNLCPDCFPETNYGKVRELWLDLGLLRALGDHDNAKVELTETGLDSLGLLPSPAPSE